MSFDASFHCERTFPMAFLAKCFKKWVFVTFGDTSYFFFMRLQKQLK